MPEQSAFARGLAIGLDPLGAVYSTVSDQPSVATLYAQNHKNELWDFIATQGKKEEEGLAGIIGAVTGVTINVLMGGAPLALLFAGDLGYTVYKVTK